MVDYITTDFSNVRGGGNIKTQTPISEDFITEAVLSDVSDGVYVLSLLSEVRSVDLTVSTTEFHVGETSTFTAVVSDENDDPLESENVVFKVGAHIVGSAITNSNGVATYTYTGESYGNYNLIGLCKGVKSNIEILSIDNPIPVITLGANPQTVEIGNPITLTGNSSNFPDREIQIYDGSTLIAYAYNDGNGDFNKKLYLSQGAHVLKAVSVADDDYSIGESTPVLVTVNDGEPPVVSGIGLITDKSIISAHSGEYATLSATVLDQNSNPMPNVEVEFFNGVDSMGTKTTDTNGVAVMTYTAVGDGDLTFKASIDSFESNVTIEDYLYYNTAEVSRTTTNGSTLYDNDLSQSLPSKCEISFDIHSNNNTDSGEHRFFLLPKTQYSSGTTQPNYGIYVDALKTKMNIGKRENGSTVGLYPNLAYSSGSYRNFKILKDGTSLTFYIDGNMIGTSTISWIGNYSDYCLSMIRWSTSGTSKIRNVKFKKVS